MSFRLFVDACKTGYGFILMDNESIIYQESGKIEGRTTNEAEYLSLVNGLQYVLDQGIQSIDIYSDSELVVNQLNNKYRVKSRTLQLWHNMAGRRMSKLRCRLQHIPGELNPADALSRGGKKDE